MRGIGLKIQSFCINHYRSMDKGLLNGIFILLLFGLFLTFAASPGVAERNHYEPYHFIKRQLIFIGPAVFVMMFTAFLSFKFVRRLSGIILLGALLGMVWVLLFGVEVKGASRWMNIGPIGLQPSEFMKPAFAVVCAW
ncbi:MAG: FtsW/RodA/SpoVE family cell cycle protein, partial [Alphaproteobacteria bacterium]|nr:FtsW/RodA/SpoVE family cell cycle protein [Alphaproteobacteria bacterium]